MRKIVFPLSVILLSVVCPTSLKAAVTEELSVVESAVPTEPAAVATASESNADAYIQTSVAAVEPSTAKSVGITPMFGGAIFGGDWKENTRNQYGLGLALELPVSTYFAFEVEGGYNNYKISYLQGSGETASVVYNRDFHIVLLGANGKIYLTKTRLRPYIGAGVMGMLYHNMYGVTPSGIGTYSAFVASANLLFGADMSITETVSIGARGSYLIPALNRPFSASATSASGEVTAAPGLEEASLMQSKLWRIMGTVTVRI